MNIAFTLHRIQQVLHYGWQHAGILAKKHNKCQLIIFLDVLYCYNYYNLWSNQYLKEDFCTLSKPKRKEIGMRYKAEGDKRDEWQKDYMQTKYFLAKWTSRKWDPMDRVVKRNKAYTEKYNAGTGLFVESNVEISRQHYLWGAIKMGKNVLLCHNTDIDYTGGLTIGNGVAIAEGTKILTHNHDHLGMMDDNEVLNDGHRTYMTPLTIGDNVLIYARCLIMPGVNSIGENSIISAGSIVYHEVPANVVVAGNPAKVVAKIKHQRVDYRYTKS